MSSASDESDRRRGVRAALRDALGLDEHRRGQKLAFFELGPEDAEHLRAMRGILEGRVDELVARFYEHLLRFPELHALLHAEPGRIARLQGMQREFFLSITDGRFDADYFEARLQVGNAHQEIGLRPVWYIGAFSRFLRLAMGTLVDATGEGRALLPTFDALIKTVFLDMSLAMNTYIYGGFVARDVAAEMERAARVAEEALRAHAEVERLKDDLASMVVHDLKNPVNGISMMVDLALRKGADLPEAQVRYLERIQQTCGEMMRLIQNLLELSKIEEGKMPIVREPIVLAELADDVVDEYRAMAAQGSRTIVIAVPTDLPAAVADRGLLRRVLVNLVVNALRHSGSSTVHVVAATGPVLGEVTLSVVDHGHGIPPAQQGKVFEKFGVIRRSPSDAPSSDTGLGLPFCKLAVERMGGRISLSSDAAATVFAVALPSWTP